MFDLIVMNQHELLTMILLKDQHQHIGMLFHYWMNLINMMDSEDQWWDHQLLIMNHLHLEN
jgi:hypothetical protein